MRKFILFLIALAALYGLFIGYRLYWRTGDAAIVATMNIPEGATFSKVQENLIASGILPEKDGWLFKWYAKHNDLDTKLAIGEVKIVIGASASKIAESIANKPRATKKLTIIEGWSLHDLKKYLQEQGVKDADDLYDYTGVPGRDYREEGGQPSKFLTGNFTTLKHKPWYVSMEGYLFPDTYEVYADTTVEEVLGKMLARMDFFIDDGAVKIFKFHDMNVNEGLAMASILEREVREFDDRRKVADMMMRRRAENWALQVDSSVNYITQNKTPSISLKDTKIDSLYNTYKYPGLPLGPIAMPSKESLQAIANPWGTAYNYFLTDKEGNVHYAETLSDHNENVRKYLGN